jgi:ActR/RegA family two-component response regulator
MVLIATADTDLALKLGEAIEGQKTYVVSAKDATELRHKVHSTQPEVVILDARFGSNSYRVLDDVPRLLEVRSDPAVIVLTPWRSGRVRDEAARLGCFDVVSLDDRAWRRKVSRAVLDAQAARLAGALERPAKREPEPLH